jgi:hypothetical protein
MMKRNFVSILVMIIYFLVLSFIVSSAVLVVGQSLMTFEQCAAGTWICLALYHATKITIYLFLVERIHIVRAPFFRRKNDKIYLGCLALLVFTVGPVVINCFIKPYTDMGPDKRRCYFGINGTASIPVLTVDIFADVVPVSANCLQLFLRSQAEQARSYPWTRRLYNATSTRWCGRASSEAC